MLKRFAIGLLTVPLLILQIQTEATRAQTRDEKVRKDRAALKDDKSWYYDDLESAIKVAKNENKPLMVVLRCIP